MRSTHKRRWVTGLFLIVILGATSGRTLADNSETTLCEDNEEVYFSCPMKDKILSVCARGNTSPDRGEVQYRYGTWDNTAKHIEMSYPSDPRRGGRAIWIEKAAWAQALIPNLRFRVGSYEYVITSGFEGGLFVLKNKALLFKRTCDAGMEGFIHDSAYKGLVVKPKTEPDYGDQP